MYGLQEVVLVAALGVVPLLGGDVGTVLIQYVVRLARGPVGVLRLVMTLLPSPLSFRIEQR